jgi:hypothetical protein
MSFGGTTIESAIQAWIVAGSGLAGAKVIWAGQGGNRPAPPYIAIDGIGLNQFGQDWKRHTYDDDADPGEEITNYVEGHREIVLSIQCFATSPLGTSAAMAILNSVVAKSRLPTVAAALLAAGVAVRRFDTINALGEVVGATAWEPRAVLTAHIGVASSVNEIGTFIETVETEEI